MHISPLRISLSLTRISLPSLLHFIYLSIPSFVLSPPLSLLHLYLFFWQTPMRIITCAKLEISNLTGSAEEFILSYVHAVQTTIITILGLKYSFNNISSYFHFLLKLKRFFSVTPFKIEIFSFFFTFFCVYRVFYKEIANRSNTLKLISSS